MKDWQIHTGDCLDVLRTLPDASVDAVITDPPYNVGFKYADDPTSDGDANYGSWCCEWFSELCRVCRGPIAVTPGMANIALWSRIAPPDWWMCWHKPAAMGRCHVGFNNWEPIALWGTMPRAACDVIRAPITPDADVQWHPCPKPLAWAEKLLEAMTTDGQIVLDPFTGSGTVGKACRILGRRFIGIERSPEYAENARRRISGEYCPASLFPSQPMLIGGGA